MGATSPGALSSCSMASDSARASATVSAWAAARSAALSAAASAARSPAVSPFAGANPATALIGRLNANAVANSAAIATASTSARRHAVSNARARNTGSSSVRLVNTHTDGRLPSTWPNVTNWPDRPRSQVDPSVRTCAPMLSGASGTEGFGGGAAAAVAFASVCSVAVKDARFCGSFSRSVSWRASAWVSAGTAGAGGLVLGEAAGSPGTWAIAGSGKLEHSAIRHSVAARMESGFGMVANLHRRTRRAIPPKDARTLVNHTAMPVLALEFSTAGCTTAAAVLCLPHDDNPRDPPAHRDAWRGRRSGRRHGWGLRKAATRAAPTHSCAAAFCSRAWHSSSSC